MNTFEKPARFSILGLGGRTTANSRKTRERKRRPTLENLERRELLTTINYFTPVLAPQFNASITSDSTGNLWIAALTSKGTSAIEKVSTDGTLLTQFPIPNVNSVPGQIIAANDGNLWITTAGGGNTATGGTVGGVLKMTPAGAFTTYDTTLGPARSIAIGPDGNPWYLEQGSLVMIDPSKAPIDPSAQVVHSLGSEGDHVTNNYPGSLTAGPNLSNGHATLYFTESNGPNLGLFDVTTGTLAAPIALPDGTIAGAVVNPGDGTLWFGGGSNIVSSGSVLQHYDLATQTDTPYTPVNGSGINPVNQLVMGPDHNVWFTMNGASIVEFDTTKKTFIPNAVKPSMGPGAITSGPGNNLWFVDTASSQIGQVSLDNAPPPSADLSVTASELTTTGTPLGSTVHLGDSFVYSLDVKNVGPNAASNATFTAVLPAGTTYSGPSGSGGLQYDPGTNTLTYNVASVPVGDTVVPLRVYTVMPGSSTTFTVPSFSVSVRSDTADPVTTNNVTNPPFAALNVNAATSDLSITAASVSPPSAQVGNTVTFTLTVQNAGPSPASNLVVTVPMAAGLVYVGPTGGTSGFSYTNHVVTYKQSILPVTSTPGGHALTLNIPVQGTVEGFTSQPLASVTSDGSTPGTHPLPSVQFTTAPLLSLTSQVSTTQATVGSPFTYTIPVTNKGKGPAFNVHFVALLPVGLSYQPNSASPIRSGSFGTYALNLVLSGVPRIAMVSDLGTIDAGATLNVKFSVTPDSNALPSVTLVSSVTTSSSPTQTWSIPVNTSVVAPAPAYPLTMSIVSAPSSVTLNSANQAGLLYTLKITNNAATTISGATFQDILPSGTSSLVAYSITASGQSAKLPASVVNQTTGVVTWVIPPLAPNTSISVFMAAVVNQTTAGLHPDGNLVNKASVAPGASGGKTFVLPDFTTKLVVPVTTHTVDLFHPPAAVAKPAAAVVKAAQAAIASLPIPKSFTLSGVTVKLKGPITLQTLVAENANKTISGTATVMFSALGGLVNDTVTMTFTESYVAPTASAPNSVNFGTYDSYITKASATAHAKILQALATLIANKTNKANIVTTLA